MICSGVVVIKNNKLMTVGLLGVKWQLSKWAKRIGRLGWLYLEESNCQL